MTYKYVEVFYNHLDYDKEFIEKMQQQARKDNAPHDAAYKCGKGWMRWANLSFELRQKILKELR